MLKNLITTEPRTQTKLHSYILNNIKEKDPLKTPNSKWSFGKSSTNKILSLSFFLHSSIGEFPLFLPTLIFSFCFPKMSQSTSPLSGQAPLCLHDLNIITHFIFQTIVTTVTSLLVTATFRMFPESFHHPPAGTTEETPSSLPSLSDLCGPKMKTLMNPIAVLHYFHWVICTVTFC